jgi:hypothetical protein
LARWQRLGAGKRLHTAVLAELRRRGQLDLARAIVDGASLRALCSGTNLERTLPIAARPGRSITFLTDSQGIPLVARLTGANRHDVS